MFKMKLFLIPLLSFFVLSSSNSFAQEKKILKFKKEGPFIKEFGAGLDLSDSQKKQFDDLELQFEKKLIDLRADVEKAKLAKREMINKGDFSKNDYLAAEEKILLAENKIQMEKAKLKMDKYALLDLNQKKIFMDGKERNFIFNFDMDGFKDGMRIFREKMRHLPEMFEWKELDKEIEAEIESEEI